jgi:hypothetical protein
MSHFPWEELAIVLDLVAYLNHDGPMEEPD